MLDDGKKLMDKLSEFGEIIDVPRDGNCGYHSIYFGLQAIGKTDSLESTKILYFRKTLWNHAKKPYDELINNEVYQFFSNDPERRKKQWNREILSRIHDPTFDYKEDAPRELWYHSTLISPIVSHYFKTHIIIFSVPIPSTLLFENINGRIKVRDNTKKNNF